MKMIGLPVLGSFSGLVWVILAQQSEDQSETASMMKEKQSDKNGMHGMGDMSGMME